MLSPKTLINLFIFTAIACTALFVILLRSPPYTGFMLEKDPNSDYMRVITLDDWVAGQGLNIGDIIVSVSTINGSFLDLAPRHVLTSTFQARHYYENRKARLKEFARVHEVFNNPVVRLHLASGESIDLTLDHSRPLSSISWGVWFRFFLGLAAPFMGALVWVWQPQRKETLFLVMSGVGLFVLTLPSAASIYTTDMFYPNPFLFWLLKLAGAAGTFMLVGFATCMLLYFPQKIQNADIWSRRLLSVLLIYALVTLFNDWQLNAPLAEQFLYYSYNETYLPTALYFSILVYLCTVQWRLSGRRPVERAQALWVILSWTIGPSIYVIFYLLPVVLGHDAILSRTMNTAVIASGFWMILAGVARFQLFHIEQYIGAAYQWTFVSLLFFSLDILMVYAVHITPQVSTYILFGLVIWCYFPVRQWILQRFVQNRQHKYQGLFNEAVVQMVEVSMLPTTRPQYSWHAVLKTIFSPAQIQSRDHGGQTRVGQRGQTLFVANNRYSPATQLDYAENGTRLFSTEDEKLVQTLNFLFERWHDFRDAYFSGQTQERERIRRDLHDQVGHKLLSLIYTAKDDSSRRLAQETMEQLRDLIQALKDEPVSLNHSIARLKLLTEEACEHAGLAIQWNDLSSQEWILISSNQHLNIQNIVRELINNTIRHAHASSMAVSITYHSGTLEISVSDNGTGFNQQNITPGNGLHNIQSRVEELDATIKWCTSSGTQVKLRVPVQKAGAILGTN